MSTVAVAATVERMRQISAEHLEVDPEQLTMTGHFVADCGADSSLWIDLLAGLEREYNGVIDYGQLERR